MCSCRENATPSTTASTMFNFFLNFQNHRGHVTTTCESFIAIGWTVCAPIGTQTLIFIYKLYIYIKFPKPPRACLQQLLKVSSQSDERCVLLCGTHTHTHTHADRQTLIFIYKIVSELSNTTNLVS